MTDATANPSAAAAAAAIRQALASFAACYPMGRKVRGRGFRAEASRAVIRRRNRRSLRRMAMQLTLHAARGAVDGIHVMRDNCVRIASMECIPGAFDDPESVWEVVQVCR